LQSRTGKSKEDKGMAGAPAAVGGVQGLWSRSFQDAVFYAGNGFVAKYPKDCGNHQGSLKQALPVYISI